MAELGEIYHELPIEEQYKVKVCIGWLTAGNSVWDLAMRVLDPGARGLEALDDFYKEVTAQTEEAYKPELTGEALIDKVQEDKESLLANAENHLRGRKYAIDG